MDLVRSYLALACVAFMVGFGSYWMARALGGPAPSPAASADQAPVAATLPGADFQRGKQI